MGGWHIEKDARMNGPDGQPLAGMISIHCLYPSILAKWLVWGKHLRRGEEVSSTHKSLTSNNIVFQRFIPGQPRLKKICMFEKMDRICLQLKKRKETISPPHDDTLYLNCGYRKKSIWRSYSHQMCRPYGLLTFTQPAILDEKTDIWRAALDLNKNRRQRQKKSRENYDPISNVTFQRQRSEEAPELSWPSQLQNS